MTDYKVLKPFGSYKLGDIREIDDKAKYISWLEERENPHTFIQRTKSIRRLVLRGFLEKQEDI